MGKVHTFFTGILAVVVTVMVAWLFLNRNDMAVLNPEGTVSGHQSNLLFFALLLSLVVVVPVYVLTFYIARKYREGNKKSKYAPDWNHSNILESIWWGIPVALIVVLAVVAWKSSHDLDPYKPLTSDKKPITIQVVALEWKWLFLYPDQNIATVNYVEFPEKTPVNFEITADAPMNSFWIPKLGGQVYAMAGMQTKLHLEANKPGVYTGTSANLSGEGFAGMTFTARASTKSNFEDWVKSIQQSPDTLSASVYEKLAQKSKNNPETFYASYDDGLFDSIMQKYMSPKDKTAHVGRRLSYAR